MTVWISYGCGHQCHYPDADELIPNAGYPPEVPPFETCPFCRGIMSGWYTDGNGRRVWNTNEQAAERLRGWHFRGDAPIQYQPPPTSFQEHRVEGARERRKQKQLWD